MSSWRGITAVFGCALLQYGSVAQAQEVTEPLEGDAGAEADAGPQLVPAGTGVCLEVQGACDANGACEGEAACASGMCFGQTGACTSGDDCLAGEYCVVFGAEACSAEEPCPTAGDMCSEQGQCFALYPGTAAAVVEGDAGAGDEEPTASSADAGAESGAAADETSSDSKAEEPSASTCSASVPSSRSFGTLGVLTLALGTMLQRRRRSR